MWTIKEVQQKNNKDSVLLIIHDKVYNVTNFLNEHPGGEEILLDHGGKDATEDFIDVAHSGDAVDLMKNYLVGELVETDRKNIKEKPGWVASSGPKDEKYVSGPGMPFYLLLLGIVAVIAASWYLR